MRLRTLNFFALAAIVAAAALSVAAQTPERDPDSSTLGGTGPLKDELTPEVRQHVHRGLEWLARNINSDGTINGGGGDSAAIMALAGIAFLADGDMPGQGPYGREVERVLDFILKSSQESGLITSQNYGSPMYGHGFATLFLAEVYGMSPRPEVKEKLQNAVRLIVNCQNTEGGWRYQPVPVDADLSVTICQIMALRAARNDGIKIPPQTIDKATDYVRRSQEPDGGFSYMLNSRGSAYPRSAAGVCALYYLRSGNQYEDELKKGVKYLMQNLPGHAGQAEEYQLFYGNYYATQAMFMAGGPAWEAYWPALRTDMLQRQQADGSWNGETGQVYGTAMALIMLQVPNRLLPVLQK